MFMSTALVCIAIFACHDLSAAMISDSISITSVMLPAAVKSGGDNYRIYGQSTFDASRVYTETIAGDNVLVGWSGSDGIAYVSLISSSDEIVRTDSYPNLEVRGLVAHDDGSYAVLLWDESYTEQIDAVPINGAMFARLVSPVGTVMWNTMITVSTSSPEDFLLGDSRMTFGDERYAAYFPILTASNEKSDAYIFLHSSNGSQIDNSESGGWNFGCSRSMSNLLNYNPSLSGSEAFLPVCVTDCYPGTVGSNFSANAIGGIYINNANKVMDVAGDCAGNVGAELGGVAYIGEAWRMVFNAHQAAAPLGSSGVGTGNQDIGFVSIDSTRNIVGSVTWLTTTPAQESNAGIARFIEPGASVEKFLVGWVEDGVAYKMGLYNSTGDLTESEGVVDVTGMATWGDRDDPFRTLSSGGVVWTKAAAGMNVLTVYRVASGGQVSENEAFTELQNQGSDNVNGDLPYIVGGGILAAVIVAAIIITALIQQRAGYRNIIKGRQARDSLHSVASSKEQPVEIDYSSTSS